MTSDLNSVTSITYVAMSFWPQNAFIAKIKGQQQRRESTQIVAALQAGLQAGLRWTANYLGIFSP